MPQKVRLKDTALSGELQALFDNVKNATFYQLRHSDTLDENWNESYVPFTKSKAVITGLKPGTSIWVQVRAINPNGYSEWSDPANLMAR